MTQLDPRRHAPRLALDGFCGVVGGDRVRHAAMLDLSTAGLRVERVFDPTTARRIVQLEIELPGVDEIVCATAAVTRAYLTPLPRATPEATQRFWCRAGLHITETSRRERRLLMDYVIDNLQRGTTSTTPPRTLARSELPTFVARAPRAA